MGSDPVTSQSLIVSVDTEPDDQWAPPLPSGKLPAFTCKNTRALGRLKDFLHGLGAPVTWMTSYSVVRDPESARVLREAIGEGDEVAGHLHGWETPPYTDMDDRSRPFIYEYDPAIRLEKHRSLVAAHGDAFGVAPVSYRAGRWGIDAIEYEHLMELGYRIDSSIPPGIDFRDRGGPTRLGPDFRRHLTGAPPAPHRVGSLWEVPVSITPIGLLGPGHLAATLLRVTGARKPPDRAARLATEALSRSGLARLVWVRPRKHPREDLVRAVQSLVDSRAPFIHIMFHSSEAFEGTSPLSRTAEEVEQLFGDLEAMIRAATLHPTVKPRTLRDAVAAWVGK